MARTLAQGLLVAKLFSAVVGEKLEGRVDQDPRSRKWGGRVNAAAQLQLGPALFVATLVFAVVAGAETGIND